jgi:hypothetical protein
LRSTAAGPPYAAAAAAAAAAVACYPAARANPAGRRGPRAAAGNAGGRRPPPWAAAATAHVGVGLSLSVAADAGAPAVAFVWPGGPAHAAGVAAGDRVERIGAARAAGLTADEANGLLMGPAASAVRVALRRPGVRARALAGGRGDRGGGDRVGAEDRKFELHTHARRGWRWWESQLWG